MSAHVDAIIADMTAKRDALSEMILKLEWFKVEFPHTAAGLVATGDGTGGTKLRKRSKRAAPVTREKPPAKTTAATTDASEVGEKILAALKQKSPRPSGELAKLLRYESTSALRYHALPLIKAGLVTFIRAGSQSGYGLPGKTPARGHL